MELEEIEGRFNMLEDEQQQDLLDDDLSMDDHQLLLGIDQDFPNTLVGEPAGASGDEQDLDRRNRGKRKRNHRHTTTQIQRLEAFFKECPHPDDAQRKLLGQELGLEPLQVKFWFQNKRTQTKNHNEREENQRLKDENDQLLLDNLRLKEALNSACCPNCGGPPSLGEISVDEQELQAENARLCKEIERISAIVEKHASQHMMSFQMLAPSAAPGIVGGPCLMANTELGKPEPNEIRGKPTPLIWAQVAMEELLAMAQLGEPIWTPSYNDHSGTETLNEEEYARAFPEGIGPKMVGLRTEASCETAIVSMNAEAVVSMLMDMNKWSAFFSTIVARATTVEIYPTTGIEGSYDGTLQLMNAELQVPSPLVPVREGLFLRYCKHHGGVWIVVDVSMEVRRYPMAKYRRRPSGCIIQEMPNNCSKVIWIEHVEIDDSGIHEMYKPIMSSGIPFGAKRWISMMSKQCEKFAGLLDNNTNISNSLSEANSEATSGILKLAERMMISFCSGVSGSAAHHWAGVVLAGRSVASEEVRIRSRKNNGDPGRPPGVVLSASTSIWLPVSPKRIFDLLRSVTYRNQWDILLHGNMLHETARYANGQEQGNCVSLFSVGHAEGESNMMIVQESFTDSICSYVIYAPVDAGLINSVLRGGDSQFVALLPSGFAILPGGPSAAHDEQADDDSAGSLLTVAFQILLDSCPNSKISIGSVATVKSLLSCTCDRIRTILLSNNDQ